MKLLTTNNYKLLKGEGEGYLTYGLHLAPFNLSGHQVCPMASAGCASACLNTAGRGAMSSVQKARIAKTKLLFSEREFFIKTLKEEINKAKRKAERLDKKLAVRLNVTSDIPWEAPTFGAIPFEFEDVQFYDYTKRRSRAYLPNYHITYSMSENTTDRDVVDAVSGNMFGFPANVAVVFSGKLPYTYLGYRVVDGDVNDLRFLDPEGVIVGLSAKGKAKKDTSGFVKKGA